MYEGDSPLAERRAAALSVDPALLGELLGRVEMRELLDPDVIAQFEAEAQRLADGRRVRGLEGVADLLRLLGPLTAAEVAARLAADAGDPTEETSGGAADETTAAELLGELVAARRAIEVTIAGERRIAQIEDAGRLRDALGAPLPVGIPNSFLEPVADPLADLVARHARTHGPFRTSDVAARLGIGTAVARQTLQRLESQGRIASGFFLPADTARSDDLEWCDAEVLRRLRLRSLAAIRGTVEPVPPAAFARFLPAWQHLAGSAGGRPLDGIDGVLAVIEQLAGVPLPASAWESLVLPSRVDDYVPAMLDELTATGEVVWSGHGSLPGRDGWIALHPADAVPLTLAPPGDVDEPTDLERRVLGALAGGGAYFASQLQAATDAENEQSIIDALWNLAWTGRVTNDTFAPVRALLGGGSQAHRAVRRTPRARMFRGTPLAATRGAAVPPRGAGVGGGRWSLLPELSDASADGALRSAASAGLLLERYGVVTRGSVQAEGVPGGFAQAYRTLAGFEDAGHARRGYFIETLGAAQFAASATVDRLRSFAAVPDPAPLHAITLAATDPANAYGAALAWPALEGVSHRPGRKAGGLVVLVDGDLVLYLERGGRSALAFTDDEAALQAAARSLVDTARARRLDTLTIEQVSGAFVYGTPAGRALLAAGFVESSRGLTLRRAR